MRHWPVLPVLSVLSVLTALSAATAAAQSVADLQASLRRGAFRLDETRLHAIRRVGPEDAVARKLKRQLPEHIHRAQSNADERERQENC